MFKTHSLWSAHCEEAHSLSLGCEKGVKGSMRFTSCHRGQKEISEHMCLRNWTETKILPNLSKGSQRHFFVSARENREQLVCYSYVRIPQGGKESYWVSQLGQECGSEERAVFHFNISKVSECSEINASTLFLVERFLLFYFVFISL